MSRRAIVAYENRRRQKKPAVKPLKWHRQANGDYKAKGARGELTLFSRTPDRRRNVYPWVVTSGGKKGVEIKPGGFDLKSEAQTFAAQYDAGLCGQPPTKVVVQAAPGMPAGTYRGTLAAEGREPSDKYESKVIDAVSKMVSNDKDAYAIVGNSPEYVAQMEAGGIDPAIVAAVLVATKDHSHVHNDPGKHVELAEAGRREHHIFRGQRFDIFHTDGSWWYQLDGSGYGQGGLPSHEAAMAAAQRALGMPAGFSMAVEEARKKGRIWDWQGEQDYYSLRYSEPLGYTLYFGPDADDLTFLRGWGTESGATSQSIRAWVERFDRGEELHPSYRAGESKKRLWQPDPGSGLWITRSSLNQAYFLMWGDQVLRVFNSRAEAEDEAKRIQDQKKLELDSMPIEKGTADERRRRPKA